MNKVKLGLVICLVFIFFLKTTTHAEAAADCHASVKGLEAEIKLSNPGNYSVSSPIPVTIFVRGPGVNETFMQLAIPAAGCTGSGIGNGQNCFVDVPLSMIKNNFNARFSGASPDAYNFQYAIGGGEAPFCSDTVSAAMLVTAATTQQPLDNPATNLSTSTFDSLNPLKKFGDLTVSQELSTPGGIIGRVLRFIFPIAGLILFVMIIWGGFEMVSGATDKKSLDSGKNRITAALMGFILLFASYWIMQIIQVIFGVKVL